MKRAGKWLWGALGAASTVQFAAWFLGLIFAILAAGYANLSTGFRIALGVAVFGFATCLLLALIPLLPASIRRKPKAEQNAPQRQAVAVEVSPYSHAALLQRQHDETAQEERERERIVNVRRAFREVREELRDNRLLVQRVGEGETDAIHELTATKWDLYEGTLLDIEDSEPHSAVRDANRELARIQDTQYTRDPENPRVSVRRDFPSDPLETDIATTLEAIDKAIKALDKAEGATR